MGSTMQIRRRSLRRVLVSLVVVTGITWLMLEIILQIAFMRLPAGLIMQMPQYPQRYGIRYNTSHGAREYPAHEQVNLAVNRYSGDLYSISCLSPASSPPVEPYQVRYTRDMHGFRNAEPYPDDVSLVVVGDSFTAAESIQHPYWQDITPSTLAFGTPGSGSVEQLLLLREYGLPHHPEHVVMAYFGGNDLIDSAHFYRTREAGKTLDTLQSYPFWDYLVTFHIALRLRSALVPPPAEPCLYPVQDEQGTSLADYNTFLEPATIDEVALRDSHYFAITRDAIIAAAQETKAAGGEFILMFIPFKMQVYWQKLSPEVQQQISTRVAPRTIQGDELEMALVSGLSTEETAARLSQNLGVQRELLAELAQTHGFRFLDLTPVFEAAAQRGEETYFFSDTHWNQTGHDLARQTLEAFLAQAEAGSH
jgi:hypothetical protein